MTKNSRQNSPNLSDGSYNPNMTVGEAVARLKRLREQGKLPPTTALLAELEKARRNPAKPSGKKANYKS